MSLLKENGIESFTGPRDVIVNLTNHVNLGFEGYSAVFEGYRIYTEADNAEKSKQLIAQKNFKLRNLEEPRLEENIEMKKFLSGAIFSLLLPGIMNTVSIYWLFRALVLRQKISFFRFTFACLIWLATASASLMGLWHFLKR
jgi:hypothetical protein